MDKPIIATTLSGLFVKSEPWEKAHILWFEEMAKDLDDESIKEWATKPNYFQGVDEVMKRIYPNASEQERTERARESYFNSVIKYIKQNPQVKNAEIIDYFKFLKEGFRIGLITTNTQDAINQILKILDIKNLFDFIETSYPGEKDDKTVVFERFIDEAGKPVIYIGGDRKDSYDYCQQNKIPAIFANFEGKEDIENVISVHSLDELRTELGNTNF